LDAMNPTIQVWMDRQAHAVGSHAMLEQRPTRAKELR